MNEKLNVKIIIGSTREKRFSDKPAAWIAELARTRNDFEVEILDLRDYPLPFFDQGISPSQVPLGQSHGNSIADRWAAKIHEADAFIMVTAEYNHNIPAVLKNALDWVYKEWNNKAVACVSWGSANGARAVETLRLIAGELQMADVRQAVLIPSFLTLLDENGNLKPEALEGQRAAAGIMLDQLSAWGKAMKEVREDKFLL